LDQPLSYDYWKDTFGTSRPRVGYAGGRPSANMTPIPLPESAMPLPADRRLQSDYQENEFESLAMGIGFSLLEKEKEKLLEKKRQMV
jgi:hypothetical protein